MSHSFENLMGEVECVKKKLQEVNFPLENEDIWALQQVLQVKCGQLLVSYQDCALEKAVERDLWNFGFRSTITQLQAEVKAKKSKSEAKDVLNWFLNSASGFYIQLLNQICSANSLDFVFRRKDSVFGISNGKTSSGVFISPKEGTNKNALYLCQYCLIHLGDLARYRHQAKQAETFYKHAVSVAATSGHPYNQLALLEAGRGNRLTSVFLYIRALCLAAPFPGAPSNLVQTFSKVLQDRNKSDNLNLSSESDLDGRTLLTKDEYINLFLVFHSSLFLKGDLDSAKDQAQILSSTLSILVAGSSLTRTNLVQMFAVCVFACYYFSGRFDKKITDDNTNKKEEERMIDPKECDGAVEVVEDLLIGMLAALLLPVHAMKESELALTYPALPAIRLMFEWILLEGKLDSSALKKKQQIWSGLCKLVNFLQQPLKDFTSDQFEEVPLPEDWDLQEFQPLRIILCRYRYRSSDPRLTPDQYSLLRAKRLTEIAYKLAKEDMKGCPVLKTLVQEENNSSVLRFEPVSNQPAPMEDVLNLEKLTLQCELDQIKSTATSNKLNEKKDGTKGLLITQEKIKTELNPDLSNSSTSQIKDKATSLKAKTSKSVTVSQDSSSSTASVMSKPRSSRTNVALQAILKRNSGNQETKQVKFRSPSPNVSSNSNTTFAEKLRGSNLGTVSSNANPIKPSGSSYSSSPVYPDENVSFPNPPPSNSAMGVHTSFQNKPTTNYPHHRPYLDSSMFSSLSFPIQAARLNSPNVKTQAGPSAMDPTNPYYSEGKFQGMASDNMGLSNIRPGNLADASHSSSDLGLNTLQPNFVWSNNDSSFVGMSSSSNYVPHGAGLSGQMGGFSGAFQTKEISPLSLLANPSNQGQITQNKPLMNLTRDFRTQSSINSQWWSKPPPTPISGNGPPNLGSVGIGPPTLSSAGIAPPNIGNPRIGPPNLGSHGMGPPNLCTPGVGPPNLSSGGVGGIPPYSLSTVNIPKNAPPSQVFNQERFSNVPIFDRRGHIENPNISMRSSSNTYSLFGPLGGGGGGGSSSGGPENNTNNPLRQMLGPQSDPQAPFGSFGQQRPQMQFPPHQSLWSGPSPLQRLLEQKMSKK